MCKKRLALHPSSLLLVPKLIWQIIIFCKVQWTGMKDLANNSVLINLSGQHFPQDFFSRHNFLNFISQYTSIQCSHCPSIPFLSIYLSIPFLFLFASSFSPTPYSFLSVAFISLSLPLYFQLFQFPPLFHFIFGSSPCISSITLNLFLILVHPTISHLLSLSH